MPATRRARHLAAGDEHFLLVTDAGEAFRGEFRGEFRGGARVAALVFDAGAPGSDGTIPRDVKITHVAAGSRHSALVDADGRVWTFGWGLYGQLGHETCEDASDPKPIAALGACFARAVAAGAAHTSVLVSTGGLRVRVEPRRTAGRAAERVRARRGDGDARAGGVFVGRRARRLRRARERRAARRSPRFRARRHTACVTSLGDLVTWGWNAYGQLGVRDRETRGRRRESRRRTSLGKVKKKRAPSRGRWHTVVAHGDDGSMAS